MPPEADRAAPVAAAASVILLRRAGDGAQVLMGQRGAVAAFMPSKFVFPGGRVDASDYGSRDLGLLHPACRRALNAQPRGPVPRDFDIGLTSAALRELDEETGLHLVRPRMGALRFAFRAITPPGRSRRFDARFFVADAADFDGDSQGFSAACGELTALQWVPLTAVQGLDLPFITRVILAEIAAVAEVDAMDTAQADAQGVPFFDNSSDVPQFLRL